MSSKTEDTAAAVKDLIAFFQELERSTPGFAHPGGEPERILRIGTEEGSQDVALEIAPALKLRRRRAATV